jgi:hypothetical protein
VDACGPQQYTPAAAAAAAGAGGDDDGLPWWMVLPDFVPVQVLLMQQMNPRWVNA